MEGGLEAVGDEAELLAKALLRDVLGAGLGDVHLDSDGDEERQDTGTVVVDHRREVVDLLDVGRAVLLADPDDELVDDPGDGRIAELLGVAGDAVEAGVGVDPEVLGAGVLLAVVAPAVELGGEGEAGVEVAAAHFVVEGRRGDVAIMGDLLEERLEAAVTAGVALDELEDALLIGKNEALGALGQGFIKGLVEGRGQAALAHHVQADDQRAVAVEPGMGCAQASERWMAEVVHRGVALEHLAENGQ